MTDNQANPPHAPTSHLQHRPAPPNGPEEPRAQSGGSQVTPLKILWLSIAFFVAASLLCLALAFGWIPGYPKSAQKNVAIYYQATPAETSLAAYLHPPLNSIQAPQQSQLLAFQFTNRGAVAIAVQNVKLLSTDCFVIQPAAPDSASSPAARPPGLPQQQPLALLQPNQSALIWYRLKTSESPSCEGQWPLVFLYTWQAQAASAAPGAHHTVPSSVNNPPPTQQQSISTGPIQITTLWGLRWERFFSLGGKIIPLILLPVLLAIGNYLLQDLQQRKADWQKRKDDERSTEEKRIADQRADQQRAQEQKLEVWKVIVPLLITAIRNHYVPILRVLTLLEDEAGSRAEKADLNDILACAFLLRRKINFLMDDNGGFYFRNHRAEDLSATLSNYIFARLYTLSGDRQAFREAAESLTATDTLNKVRQTLSLDEPEKSPFAKMYQAFQEKIVEDGALAQLQKYASFLRKVVEYEINDPFYPFWYETAPSPLNIGELRGYVDALGLDGNDKSELSNELDAYLESLPARTRHLEAIHGQAQS